MALTDPFGNPDYTMADQSPSLSPPQMAPVPKIKRGGMFGSGKGFGDFLANFVIGLNATNGNPMAAAFLKNQMNVKQQGLQREQELSDYQRKRQDTLSDWMTQQRFKLEHPDDDIGQQMRAAGIDPNSDYGKQLRVQALMNKVNPFQMMTQQNPDGSEQRVLFRPSMGGGMGGGGTPTAPVGKLTPIDDGGPTPSASGGFRGY